MIKETKLNRKKIVHSYQYLAKTSRLLLEMKY